MGRIAVTVVLLVLVAGCGCTGPSTPAGVEGRTATAEYTVTLATGCADEASATPGATTRPGATPTARTGATADRPDRSAGSTNGSAPTPATDAGDCRG